MLLFLLLSPVSGFSQSLEIKSDRIKTIEVAHDKDCQVTFELRADGRLVIQVISRRPPGPGPDDGDDSDENSDDTDPGPGEYDGPNKFGLGQLSFDNAPAYNQKVVAIYQQGADHLFGRPGPEIKVIRVEDTDSRHNTDYELPVWLANQMQPIAAGNQKWRAWYAKVMAKSGELSQEGKIKTIYDWFEALREMAAGVEARK